MAELLAPAGNMECLDAAFGEGADAVYLGVKSFNARLRASNFAWREVEAIIDSAHKRGKKIYIALNTVAEERDTERLYRTLCYFNAVHPDALITQDWAIVRMVKEFFPALVLHASTQMNVASAAGVRALAREGFTRVVLGRELTGGEIKAIKKAVDTEIEVFVHGSLCASCSGLCLFSSFLGGKSANRGMCAQACRRKYTAEGPSGIKDGYFFSPMDMCLIDHIPELIEEGIESFKIEGRMKSAQYVGTVTAAYRYVMDNWQKDKKGALITGKRLLASDFARDKTTYWYDFHTVEEGIEKAQEGALNPDQAGGTGLFLGHIAGVKAATPSALVAARSAAEKANTQLERIELARLDRDDYEVGKGDSIRLHRADDSGRKSYKVRSVVYDEDYMGNKHRWIDVPEGFLVGDSVYLLQASGEGKRYPRFLPSGLKKYRRLPKNEVLPVMDLTAVAKGEMDYVPEGIYVMVSSVQDLFIAQGARPVCYIIELNHETEASLIAHRTPLPVQKSSVFISLDPYCAEGDYGRIKKAVESLIAIGFTQFIVNNACHIELLRGRAVKMIAGPYLYTFNRWAVSELENMGIGAFVASYENSRKNLEATFEEKVRSRVIVPIFAYPALFRMRGKLPKSYDFTYFTDKENEQFKVNSTIDGSFVMPEVAYSMTDKAALFRKAGFMRLMLDFSKTHITKGQLREVITSLEKGIALQGASRFNWKEGFYIPNPDGTGGSTSGRNNKEERAIEKRAKAYTRGGNVQDSRKEQGQRGKKEKRNYTK